MRPSTSVYAVFFPLSIRIDIGYRRQPKINGGAETFARVFTSRGSRLLGTPHGPCFSQASSVQCVGVTKRPGAKSHGAMEPWTMSSRAPPNLASTKPPPALPKLVADSSRHQATQATHPLAHCKRPRDRATINDPQFLPSNGTTPGTPCHCLIPSICSGPHMAASRHSVTSHVRGRGPETDPTRASHRSQGLGGIWKRLVKETLS